MAPIPAPPAAPIPAPAPNGASTAYQSIIFSEVFFSLF
jgi:hypothetical protein